MAKLVISGPNKLEGEVLISGAKNSALAIIVAAAMAPEESVLINVPRNLDVFFMTKILEELGVKVWFDGDGLHVDGSTLSSHQVPYNLARRMRASFYVAGLLLARLGVAEVPLPGGCALGSRPVDYHIKGFQNLGAQISIEHGYMKAQAASLSGCKNYINRSSVGTTVNLMLAASTAEGTTILENPAKEPEVVDLAICLNSMGARIRGAGTDVIRIDGVKRLRGTEHTIIPDRIEAGTYALAAAITQGRVLLRNVVTDHLRAPLLKLEEAGAIISEGPNELEIAVPQRMQAVDLETAAYPGFPTDLQQPFMAMLTLAEGTSVIRETIFDRFRFVDELRRMGADLKVERDTAIVRGVSGLTGAPVEATDLRAGAALVLAGMAAEGTTEVGGVEMIDRGYERLEEKLRALGAKISREGDEKDPEELARELDYLCP
ncbi:MAG: UDP-N-acetylglucosamine 1-carboxyvinyltransferase [Firmicutes bacterium]|nr:UDP-N-acetylglucosamine 1-carboxyvinyltransferase [Bacillota bacterium]